MNRDDLRKCYNFSGRTVAVTGGCGVLGGEIAITLVWLGANVAILDRSPELPELMVERLKDAPGKVERMYVDVLKKDTLVEAEEIIWEKFGPVDTLINAAGGNHPSATTKTDLSFFDLPEEALASVFDLNLLGTILPCQVFGRSMAECKQGAILNISSMNAFRPLTRIPAYSAAKAGVSNFTQWLAVHMAQEYSPAIRVNAVAPGFFIGEQNRDMLFQKSGELTERGKKILDHTPMNRFGQPEDLIGASLWLLSSAASFVTGVVIPVDGGFSAYSGV